MGTVVVNHSTHLSSKFSLEDVETFELRDDLALSKDLGLRNL